MAPDGDERHAALARPLEDEVVRQRLIDRLADRWNRRVLTIIAPGGAGKSTAIAQAVRDNATDPTGVDLYVRCSAAVHTATDVATLLAGAIGVSRRRPADVRAEIPHLARALADFSPNEVCLHVDDVHHLDNIDGAASFLDALIDALPHHAHLVLAGRRLPRIKLGKLRAAEQLVEITANNLRFTDDEAAILAATHGSATDAIRSTGGWPALTRLALAAGPNASHEYLIEEVVDSMSLDHRRAVAAIAIAGAATDQLLSLIDTTATANELLAEVPLLMRREDGAVTSHDLWGESIDAIVDAGERQRLLEIIVEHQAATSASHATETALAAEDWDLARQHVVKAIGDGDLDLTQATLERWVRIFANANLRTPETRLLEALHARLAGRYDEAADLLEQAVHRCRDAGLIEAETTAVWEIGVVAWLSGDRTLGARQQEYATSIIERGGTRMATLMDRSMVGAHENAGRFRDAIDVYETSRVDDEIGLRHCASLAILAGDDELAARYVERLLTANDGEHAKKLVVRAHARLVAWFRGDVDPMLSVFGYRERALADHGASATSPTGVPRNDFLVLFHNVMVRTAIGRPSDVTAIAELAWARDREQTFVALAHAGQALLAGDEARATADFNARLDEIGPTRPRVYGELRRFLPYGYVLHPETREAIDADENLGPWHHQQLALARSFMALRARPDENVTIAATNGQVLAWLPLPWSMELAVRLARLKDQRGAELAGYLADKCGACAHEALRKLGERAPELDAAIASVAATVPAPMISPTHISVIGEPSVTIAGRAETIGRRRVAEVLAVLTLQPSVTRGELIELLWPSHDRTKARANLRTTLRHMRSELEPDRPAGWASFTLRQRDERIWLQRSDALTCDVWEVDDLLTSAADARTRGDDAAAERSFLDAFDKWQRDACPVARNLLTDLTMLTALDHATIDGACWVAERLLARADAAGARHLAERVLDRAPFEIRATDVLLASSLDTGDVRQAALDIVRSESIERELGVDRTPATSMLVRRYERRVTLAAS